jgi:hypothetical protein
MSKKSIRQPAALGFYASECRAERIEEYIRGFEVGAVPSKIVAGIVPHAGWIFSGAVAAKVFKCFREKRNPATFILLGAIHRWGVLKNSVDAHGSWATPLGNVDVDEQVALTLISSPDIHLVEDPRAHIDEHSLEVQLPYIKYFFPEAKIVPIAVVSDNKSALFGQKIGEIAAQIDKEIVVIGTTDLTHYGDAYGFAPHGYGLEALKWLKENDARMIDLALRMKAEEIVEEAAKHSNACGSGALAAAVSAARAMGVKKGLLVDYTTSFDVSREKKFFMGVGYAGIVF